MTKHLDKRLRILLLELKLPSIKGKRELVATFGVAIFIIALRSLGLLQSFEWAAWDRFFQMRSLEPADERITIIEIDESSLRSVGTWPLPDQIIAKLLTKLDQYQPRIIGLDIYRDLKAGNGREDLAKAFKKTNAIGIETLSRNQEQQASPPDNLDRNRVGFNNLVFDADGKIRRNLLYWHIDNQLHESFSLKLAKEYLKVDNITPKASLKNSEYLQLGKAVFKRFQPSDGSYIAADNKGYQILTNFSSSSCETCKPEPWGFRKVPLREVLADRVPENWIRDRIILIGSTAPSLQDYVQTPFSSPLIGTARTMAGVELQAHFTNELVAAALDGRPLIKVWSNSLEWLWIIVCAYLGAITRWRIKSITASFSTIVGLCFLFTVCAFILFLDGWWIPIMPGLIALLGSTLAATCQIAYIQDELKRSKEFLDQVINTIADPVFVKNKKHKWIVLNEAYCNLIGYRKEELLEKSDYDFFPKHQADAFRATDEQVLQTKQPHEIEEELTDSRGNTYSIATKRSLHKDAAGNYFLVGVIRDITKRKQMEEDLKRSAAELFRSNSELKQREDRLRYLAYHDPLTGLPNRKLFAEQIEESLTWAKTNDLMVALLFIDLDGFKQVNDTLGHEMGDRLLVTIAGRLSNVLRVSDTVARLGGDEFIIILRAIPKEDVAARVAEKILIAIAEPIVLENNVARVSASIGISIYPLNSQDAETLIKQADSAMYRAKHMGKNRYVFA
ncbi:CHASE2 domain-containing protein [Brunnivagina elsteri]|uniref:Diguanylate cyclase n=1 Tax=Brunnivagina elsteri CCALA 953 TaxID=987040 RepID=A0A2A2THE2_9CYAN|nr:CHASE2 domain-containing protein [Calothrix elsteri]PAX53227.1 diguanylate cyclase [Calothrix elsteri CCALA 953]